MLTSADIVVLASEGIRTTPGVLVRAIAAGAVPVASRLAPYEEMLDEGANGLVFEPGDVLTLSAQLTKLISDPTLREERRASAGALRETFAWPRVTSELERIYERLTARRHDDRGDRALRARAHPSAR